MRDCQSAVSITESVSQWRSSVQEMLAHLKKLNPWPPKPPNVDIGQSFPTSGSIESLKKIVPQQHYFSLSIFTNNRDPCLEGLVKICIISSASLDWFSLLFNPKPWLFWVWCSNFDLYSVLGVQDFESFVFESSKFFSCFFSVAMSFWLCWIRVPALGANWHLKKLLALKNPELKNTPKFINVI